MRLQVPPAVEYRQNDDLRVPDQEIDEIRETSQHRTMNFAMNLRIDLRACSEASKELIDGLAKLGTEAGPLLVVPVFGCLEVTLGEPANTDLVLRRRSATSVQGDSDSGFC